MMTDLEKSEFVGGLVRPNNERLCVTHIDIPAGDSNGWGKLAHSDSIETMEISIGQTHRDHPIVGGLPTPRESRI